MSLIVIGISGALLFIALRHRKSRKLSRFAHNGQDGDVLRTWENKNGDDFSYDNRPLGGRKTSSAYDGRSPGTTSPGGSSLRIVRGARSDYDWDNRSENVSKLSSWMPGWGSGDGDGDDSGSVSSSKRSYTSKQQEDNSDFLASLRQEANATMKEMVKEDHTTDPRLDDGASIKSLLTHYREVKKGTLFDNDNGKGGGGKKGGGGHGKGPSSGKASRKGKQPPPPPPRRKNNDQAAAASNSVSSTADGLSEFTII